MDVSHWDDYGLWVAAVTAGLTGLVVLARGIRRLMRWALALAVEVGELHELAMYEMRPNGGGSIKDHAAQVPALVGRMDALAEQVAGQRQILDDHLTAATQEQTSMWDAIQAIARAAPPEEP